MKAFTDLNQSKVLVEILPLESADAHYVRESTDLMGNPVDGKWSETKLGNPEKANYIIQNFTSYEILPCWSLAALLNILPKRISITTPNPRNELGYCCWNHYDEIYADNPIDACYKMIIKLKDMNLL